MLGAQLPGAGRAAPAMLLGFFGYGVSVVTFVLALRQPGTARTGAYFSTVQFVGAVVSLALFRGRPTVALLAASALMGLGVWLHVSERHEHHHLHQEPEYERFTPTRRASSTHS